MFWCSNRQVSIEEGDSKSREFGIMFIETSAKAGFNIKVKDLREKNIYISLITPYSLHDLVFL